MDSSKTIIYHEKQSLQLCLLHCLNNLFQGKDAFTRMELNAIAESLNHDDPNRGAWTPLSVIFKPHYNALTGNYDINVLIAALEAKGKKVVWHDRRNGASTIDFDGTENELMGIVLNVRVRKLLGLWKGRHWFTLRRIGGIWYNLDSDFSAPYSFKDTEEVKDFLDENIAAGAEVFLVMQDKH